MDAVLAEDVGEVAEGGEGSGLGVEGDDGGVGGMDGGDEVATEEDGVL